MPDRPSSRGFLGTDGTQAFKEPANSDRCPGRIKREDNAMEFTTKHTTAPVLSHVEAIYRPGDRQLVIDLFEALGCKTYDTGTKSPAGSTYISVHPDPDIRCQDDVIYLSEMPAEQRRLE